jgi:hypothetical protein
VLAIGADAEVCAALHPALERAGHALWCVPSPGEVEALLRLAAPRLVVLLLPPAPDATWGAALASTAAAARVGVRVVVVAPSREVVEPLAAVAGAERALSRAEVLARPLAVLASAVAAPPRAPTPPPARGLADAIPLEPIALDPIPSGGTPLPVDAIALGPAETPSAAAPARHPAAVAPPFTGPELAPRGAPPPAPPRRAPERIAALIDEELEGEPKVRPRLGRVEVNVSLVSEHNFYVGATRRVDSGGVFIATSVPPPVGTRVQVRLGLADGRKLDLDGEVAFVREKGAPMQRQGSGCGVRLVNLPGWAIDVIERFTQARPPIVHVGR